MTDAATASRPPLRVALVGLGRAMFEEHYPIYREHPALFNVVAACDLLKERRDIVARDFPHCKMFRKLADMLDEREIDLVDIATPTSEHCRHALLSLQRGFWTLVETPMALTPDETQILRGADAKAHGRLIVLHRGLFSPDFMLARRALIYPRLGRIHHIVIRKEDYVRRDDWQAVTRLGGGAACYAMTDLLVMARRLLMAPPVQMWSDLKRLMSLGDAEDCVRVLLKTREEVTAEVVYDGGCVLAGRNPSFEISGSRGMFRVMPGARSGVITAVDPNFDFPRRRTSVRTPPLGESLHEQIPFVESTVELPSETACGAPAFWKAVYQTVRIAAAFPIQLEESMESVKLVHLMKKNSPFSL